MELRNFLLSGLNGKDMQALFPQMGEVALEKGQVISEAGDEVDFAYFPSSAVLSVVTVMRDGRFLETSTVGREGGVGLLEAASDSQTHHRVFAQVPGSAMRTPAAAVRDLVRDSPDFCQMLLGLALADAAEVEQFVACNALHTAEQRLARWLLMTADRTGSRSFTLTQEYLAVMTGVQRTTISALASEMKAQGLIRYSRGNIELIDPVGLRKVACECADVAHRLFVRRCEAA